MILEFPNAITYIGGALCGLSNLMKKQLESSRGLCGTDTCFSCDVPGETEVGAHKRPEKIPPVWGKGRGIVKYRGLIGWI